MGLKFLIFLRLIMKRYWILPNAFSASNEMIMFVWFFFEFVYIVDYVDGFPYLKPSLNPWDEAYLIMIDDCFDEFLVSFCRNLLSIFASIIIRKFV